MTEEEKLSERMSSGSFSPTNDGVLTCDECGREPDNLVFHCSSHEDAQHKKEVAALEQRVERYSAALYDALNLRYPKAGEEEFSDVVLDHTQGNAYLIPPKDKEALASQEEA